MFNMFLLLTCFSIKNKYSSIQIRNLNYLNHFWPTLEFLVISPLKCYSCILEKPVFLVFKFLFIITVLQPECQFFVLYCFLKLETSTFPTIQLFAFPFAKLKPCQCYKVLIDWIIWILNSHFHSFNLILGKIFVLLMEVEVKVREYEHISFVFTSIFPWLHISF